MSSRKDSVSRSSSRSRGPAGACPLPAPSVARRRRQGGRGAVTAETAMVLPLMAAVALGLAWLIALAATQVRVVDAAREVARASARDEASGVAVGLGHRVAPRGATISVHQQGDVVVVRVRSAVRGPGGLFGFLPSVQVHAQAVAAREQQ